jgi:NitT/TauT family transport system permease protein
MVQKPGLLHRAKHSDHAVSRQLLAMLLSQIVVATPLATFQALAELVVDGELWREFGYSLGRLLKAWAPELYAASRWGSWPGPTTGYVFSWNRCAGPSARCLLSYYRYWPCCGSASAVYRVVFLTGVITTPIIYVNTLEGMLSIDARILEMASVYKIPRHLKLTEIFIPGIGTSIMSGLTTASGIAVRASILANSWAAETASARRFSPPGPSWIPLNCLPGF